MSKKLLKLRNELAFYLERNDTTNILRIRKELLKLGDDSEIEDINNSLFDQKDDDNACG